MLTPRQKKWGALGVALLLLATVKFALIAWYLQSRAADAAPHVLSCRAMVCALPGGGHLRFETAPRRGQPFGLRLEGVEARSVTAQFTMRGMDMGFNRYRFVSGDGMWRARVTLPMCVSGRREWIMTLTLDGARYQLPFQVD
jgi:hypothetical protein